MEKENGFDSSATVLPPPSHHYFCMPKLTLQKNFIPLRESENKLFIPYIITKKGQKGFVENFNTSYIFSVKKLGGANIDKLLNEPNSKEVKIFARVDNVN